MNGVRMVGMALMLPMAAMWLLCLFVYAVGYGLAYAFGWIRPAPVPARVHIPRQWRPR